MKNLIITLIIFLSLSACQEAFLGEETENTPENNFEIFWEDFDQHYGLFKVRGWDWDSIYSVNRPKVTPGTTEDELWTIMKDMIAYLDDSHTFIFNTNEKIFFASGSENDEQVATEFSVSLLKEKYLEDITDIPVEDPDDDYFYGKIKGKDIGYIYLKGIEANDTDIIDEVLAKIGDNKAIILDIRNNFGGDDYVAEAFAGRFTEERKFIYTVQEKNGIGKDDFAEKSEYYTKPVGKEKFLKPVVVLTDEVTVSAAEIFLLHMNAINTVTQIGTPTSGDFSTVSMKRFLPNGWVYQYSIMMFLLPDGSSLDGIGHIPDIFVRNSATDIAAGNDLVMERAFQFLEETHGIN